MTHLAYFLSYYKEEQGQRGPVLHQRGPDCPLHCVYKFRAVALYYIWWRCLLIFVIALEVLQMKFDPKMCDFSAERSFPTHRSLMGDRPEAIEGQAKLFRVLIAYAKYNPQVGYSQGDALTNDSE